ncbi:hypothetical protein AVEN_26069-1 [Araneus ventricosus]|uniref:RNase H type-1 domain-containing protein n=1 Tax=Araneus ventricosus TaxID=182803 RepID=A0A4Y2RTN8_ARAVE|nr:hypothetical protein AVEN_26069-1 [Araneus ventricosus]
MFQTEIKLIELAYFNQTEERNSLRLIDRKIPRSEAIKLLWVPAHVGIAINEQTDEAAKAALTSDVNIFPCVSTEKLFSESKQIEVAFSGKVQNTFDPLRTFPKQRRLYFYLGEKKFFLHGYEPGLYLQRLYFQSWSGIISLMPPVRHGRFERPPFTDRLRNNLRAALGAGALHYNWICTISTFNRKACSAVLHFLQSTNLFKDNFFN